MTKLKIVALFLGLVMLFIIPATVSAQRVPPHVFVGTATMAGAAAPDGTMVTAMVDGQEAASTMVAGGAGGYTLLVDQGDMSFTGKTVTFRVGGTDAAESATWMQGGANELDLSTATGMMPGPTAMPAPTEPPSMVGPAGPEGPRGGNRDGRGPKDPRAIWVKWATKAMPAPLADQVRRDRPAPMAPMAVPDPKAQRGPLELRVTLVPLAQPAPWEAVVPTLSAS